MMNRENKTEENTFAVTLVINAKGTEDKGFQYIQEFIEDIENVSTLTLKDSEIECVGRADLFEDEEY